MRLPHRFRRLSPLLPFLFLALLLLFLLPNRQPRVLLFHETTFNGLGAQLLRVVDALAYADAHRLHFCLHEPRYWNYACAPYHTWSCYLVTPSSCPPPDKCVELSNGKARCIKVSTRASAQLVSGYVRDVKHARELFARIWQLNTRTRHAVDNVLQTLHLPPQFVALHVRRGDKRREVPLVPLRAYARAVHQLSNETSVFIMSDSGAAITALSELLHPRQVFFVPEALARKGHMQIEHNQRYMKQNYNVVVSLLTEIEAARRAQVFISTFSSNLARVIHLLRTQVPNSTISLDDRWAPGVAWRTFGKAYCEGENANRRYCSSSEGVLVMSSSTA